MKRFTETTKWCDPWFRKLPESSKLLWQYILDNCDGAGVWVVDDELAEFQIGLSIPFDKAMEPLMSRIEKVNGSDEKMWVRKFIDYQYGTLSPDCKPHASYIALLKKHTLWIRYTKGINTLQEKEKEKETEKETEKEYMAESVFLTGPEHSKLIEAHGEKRVGRMYEILSAYKLSSGKKYKSDYHAILSWVIGEEKKRFPVSDL
jgi:hypothetical protein